MDKEELYDLIERYLDEALPDAERLEVERRMAADADFRAEVELHRAMQEHLGDPGELRLRVLLEDVRKETKPNAGFSIWRRYWAAAAAILVLLVAMFWWLRPSPTVTEQPVVETPSLPAPVPDQKTGQDEQQPISPMPDKELQPIAMADPADFVPNADLEEIMGSQLRSSGTDVALLSPDSGAVLKRRSDKTVVIPVDVRLGAGLLSEGQPFKMFVYSNKPDDWEKKKPLFSRDLPLVAIEDTVYEARFRQKLSLKPGLYYLVIRQQRLNATEDPYRTRLVGKFSVPE